MTGEVYPNFGHSALTSSFYVYKLGRCCRNATKTINRYSTPKTIFKLTIIVKLFFTCKIFNFVNYEVRAECPKLGHTTLLKGENELHEEKHETVHFCMFIISGHNKLSLAFANKPTLMVREHLSVSVCVSVSVSVCFCVAVSVSMSVSVSVSVSVFQNLSLYHSLAD